jgi:DNA (cytosine-5)-methyltransferase 1
MIYGSVCSGIEAATVAWHGLGWKPAFFSEIEAFPRAVLTHHWPSVPLHGDFTTIQAGDYDPIDLLVGGTPCQSFSIAGLRGGLDDDRGNLALEFLRLADRLRPRWLVWENVPGVITSTSHAATNPVPPPPPLDLGCDGAEMETEDEYASEELHAFYCFLAGLSELGYGFAYRVLDAQFAGVPQRRRRVFVVGYLGDWRRAAAVLFERHSLQGHPAPRRGQGAPVAAITARGVGTCGADDKKGQAGHLIAFGGNNTSGPIDVATALNACHSASGRMYFETETFIATTLRARDLSRGMDSDCTDTLVASTITSSYGDCSGQDLKNEGLLVAHTLRAEGFDASEDGIGRGIPLVPAVSFNWQAGGTQTSLGYDPDSEVTGALHVGQTPAIAGNGVRRLTPRECERLQGFPDDYTRIPVKILKRMPKTKHFHRYPDLYGRNDDGTWTKYAADGPRYKALGNSMAVPVMRWIGERIAMVEALP